MLLGHKAEFVLVDGSYFPAGSPSSRLFAGFGDDFVCHERIDLKNLKKSPCVFRKKITCALVQTPIVSIGINSST